MPVDVRDSGAGQSKGGPTASDQSGAGLTDADLLGTPPSDDARELLRLAAQASAETVGLVRTLLRHDISDHRWADQVGSALTQRDVASLLGKTEQAVSKDRRLLRVTARNGRPLYPVVQFDGRRPVHGLAELLEIFEGHSTVAILAWLTGESPSLGGRRPVDVLRRGEVAAVLAAGRRYAAHNAA